MATTIDARNTLAIIRLSGGFFIAVSTAVVLLIRLVASRPFGSFDETITWLELDSVTASRLHAYRELGVGVLGLVVFLVAIPTFFGRDRPKLSDTCTRCMQRRRVPQREKRLSATSAPHEATETLEEAGSSGPIRAAYAVLVSSRNVFARGVLSIYLVLAVALLLDLVLDATGLHVYCAHPFLDAPFAMTSGFHTVVPRMMILASIAMMNANFESVLGAPEADEMKKLFAATLAKDVWRLALSGVLTVVVQLLPFLWAFGFSQGMRALTAGLLVFVGGVRLLLDLQILYPCYQRMRIRAKYFAAEKCKLSAHVKKQSMHTPTRSVTQSPHAARSGSALQSAQSLGASASTTSRVSESMDMLVHMRHAEDYRTRVIESVRFTRAVLGSDPCGHSSNDVNVVPVLTSLGGERIARRHFLAAGRILLAERVDHAMFLAYITSSVAFLVAVFLSSVWTVSAVGSNELSIITVRIVNGFIAPIYVVQCGATGLADVVIALLKTYQRYEAADRIDQQRLFLRYVCHEVRVPLNTIALSISEVDDSLDDARRAVAQLVSTPNDNLGQHDGDTNGPEAPALRPGSVNHAALVSAHDAISEVSRGMALATASMKHVLDDVLLIEKIRAGKFALEVTSTRPAQIVRRVARTFQSQADSLGVRLNVQWDCVPRNLQSAVVQADPHRLVQVCANLLSNALKFSSREASVSILVGMRACSEPFTARQWMSGDHLQSITNSTSDSSGNAQGKVLRCPPPMLDAVAGNLNTEEMLSVGHASLTSLPHGDESERHSPMVLDTVDKPPAVRSRAKRRNPSAGSGMDTSSTRYSSTPSTTSVRKMSRMSLSGQHRGESTGGDSEGTDEAGWLLFRFRVVDQGVGLSRSDLKRLFRPFTQIKSGKLQAGNGTGLGLAICRQIVALHDGVIGCWSDGEGRGASFWFDVVLPRVAGGSRVHSGLTTASGVNQASAPTSRSPSARHVPLQVDSSTESTLEGLRLNGDGEAFLEESTRSMAETVRPAGFSENELEPPAVPEPTSEADLTARLRAAAAETAVSKSSGHQTEVDHISGSTTSSSRADSASESVLMDANRVRDHAFFVANLPDLAESHDQPDPQNSSTQKASAAARLNARAHLSRGPSLSAMGHSRRRLQPLPRPPADRAAAGQRPPRSVRGPPSSASAAVAHSPSPAQGGERSEGTDRFPFRGLSVLVVDDTRPNALLLARMAQRLGAAPVRTADNGLLALQEAGVGGCETAEAAEAAATAPAQWPFQVVFMDKEMPVLDGHQTTRLLRDLGFPGPIIGVSGNAMGPDRTAFTDAGADSVLNKPVSKPALVKAVQRALGRRAGVPTQQT